MSRPRRENIPALLSSILDRPVRWASPDSYAGPYDGCENALEVFNVDSDEQLSMMRKIRNVRADLEAAIGKALVVVFHTRERTRRVFQDALFRTVMHRVFIDGDPTRAAVELDMIPFSDGDAPRPLTNGVRMPLVDERGAP